MWAMETPVEVANCIYLKISFWVTTACRATDSFKCVLERLSTSIFRMNELDSLDNVTVKAIPLQALTGREGSRRLRFPDFMTIDT
jgi:hypothetical protein